MFDSVKELRKRGKRPVIRLTPAALVRTPKRAVGRPRVYPEGEPLAARYLGRRGNSRPRCMARGCRTFLKRDQEAACSQVCADRIVNEALEKLVQCRVTKKQLLELYDGYE